MIKAFTDSGLRPSGSVERECSVCRWSTWFDPLSPEAIVLPYVCKACVENPEIRCKCAACNRMFKAPHRELTAMGYHPRCAECKDIPPMQFAKVVYCWCSKATEKGASYPDEPCGKVATQQKHWRGNADGSEAFWQSWYHLCDDHAADWMYDKSDAEQKAIMRRRGARIIELEDGWTFEYPKPVVPKTN